MTIAVLALAGINLFVRLGAEHVTEWDESLYAMTAWEMARGGDWIATTFLGHIDYYNTKPPLNVWLIALSFKVFGVSLVSLRLPAVLSALATVATLLYWARHRFGAAVGLLSGLILATTFGFLYVHSGRSANTDALFTLLLLLAVVALSESEADPRQWLWLGPICAGIFLLRGLAVLMPALLVAGYLLLTPRRPRVRWGPMLGALVLFLLPVLAWGVARWQVDRWTFFEYMVKYDFLARSVSVIEVHPGGPSFYLEILAKHQYDWLLAAIVAVALLRVKWPAVRRCLLVWRHESGLGALLVAWAAVTLVVPTVMATKLPWYLNTFYPLFALGVGWVVARALSLPAPADRRPVMVAVVLLALVVAQGKLAAYSVTYRDLRHSTQGLLLEAGRALAGHTVFRNRWDRAEMFVIGGVLKAERGLAASIDDFMVQSRPGDFLVTGRNAPPDPRLELVGSKGKHRLWRRR